MHVTLKESDCVVSYGISFFGRCFGFWHVTIKESSEEQFPHIAALRSAVPNGQLRAVEAWADCGRAGLEAAEPFDALAWCPGKSR